MTRFDRLADLPAKIGQTLGVSDWILVTQTRIQQFADATADRQWIHVDPARAASGPFGTTVAHGFFTLSLLPEMWASAFALGDVRMGLNYGLNRMRFPAPVPVDSQLRGHFKLLGVEPIEGGAQLSVEATVEREGSAKPVCVAEWLTRHFV